MRNFIIIVLLVLFSINSVSSAGEDDIFEIEAEGSYRMQADSSIDLAKKLALFIAKRKAVDLAGRYLSRKSLIKVYELNRDEIYSLAAREIRALVIKETREKAGKNLIYRVQIRAWIQPSDFIKAEMEDTKQEKKEAKEEDKIPPNSKYVADIIAGRPVFSDPSEIGGHRIRYGRSRNTGLAAGGIHPATMIVLDEFIAIGTQLRIERPGKSTSVCPVDSIEPPIVKLKNGDVIKVTNIKKAKQVFPEIKKILFLGDLLFGYGEFTENNHILIPSGYVEEWWALELEKSIKDTEKIDDRIRSFIKNPFDNIPKAEEAIQISIEYDIPLHPFYLNYPRNLNRKDVKEYQ